MSYFNSFPTSHLDSTLLLFNLIINIAAKVILLKCKSDHINLQPPVFLPGEFHGQRSLADYSRTESGATERLTLSLSLSSDGFLYRDTACSHLYKLSILISYGPQSPGTHWLFDAPHTHTCVSTWAFNTYFTPHLLQVFTQMSLFVWGLPLPLYPSLLYFSLLYSSPRTSI